VLLHAFPLNRNMWKHQLAELSDTFRVVAVDLPGFGQSPRLTKPPTLQAYVDEVLETIGSLNIGKAVFGGCSMGGYILFQLYRDHSHRVQSLVLCDTKPAADTDEARQNRFNTIQTIKDQGATHLAETMLPKLTSPKTPAMNMELMGEIKFSVLSNPVQGLCHALEAMAGRDDFTELAKSIELPTLIINGRDDNFTPPEVAQDMQTLIPGSVLKIIEDAGHLAPLEQGHIVNQEISRFLG
ncbi:alpha/beta fold hydrolase, partial [bacterium]|nr:alpha/beta fold hydrolase [bacterium]